MAKLRIVVFSSLAAIAHCGVIERDEPSPTVKIGHDSYACKCYPGDNCWPDQRAWAKLNATVSGNLVAVTPVGSVCFKSFEGKATYNAAQCAQTTTNNAIANWVVEEPAQIMWPYYTNNTCDPASGQQDSVCTIGYYPEYVITAKSKEHIIAGVNFARENNIRLVIRNTGHDFMGRSTGRGALSINTHSFQGMDFVDKYTGPGGWKGGAVTLGAGVMHRDLYPVAFKKNVVVVGGECLTVGISGGYIQGGGNGPLVGLYGLAVDNVLNFDVVTWNGDFVHANAKENTDLFWALRGGGPSAWGVVSSVTFKTFPEIPTIAMILNVTGTGETFWKGFAHWRKHANVLADAGIYNWFSLAEGNLRLQPIVGPNMTRAEFDKVTVPLLDKLKADNVPYSVEVREFKTFYEMYDYAFDKAHDAGAQQALMGGRLIAKEDIIKHGDELIAATRKIIEGGYIYAGHVVSPGAALSKSDSSVHPLWYKSASQDITILPLKAQMTVAERKAAEDVLTYTIGGPLRDATPNSASYIHEGDANEPNWQETYWGTNYARLRELKRKLDPKGVFYAKTTPGTEDWAELDGKLCKKV